MRKCIGTWFQILEPGGTGLVFRVSLTIAICVLFSEYQPSKHHNNFLFHHCTDVQHPIIIAKLAANDNMRDLKLLMAALDYLSIQFNCCNNCGFIIIQLITLALMMSLTISLDLHLDFLCCHPFAHLNRSCRSFMISP